MSRSNVQLPNDKPRSCGLVRLAAINSPTCSGGYVAGRPPRRRSRKPARPSALKRVIHSRTVPSAMRNASLIAATDWPWWDSQQMRARSRSRASAVRLCATSRNATSSSSVSTRTRSGSNTGRLLRHPVSYPFQILPGRTTKRRNWSSGSRRVDVRRDLERGAGPHRWWRGNGGHAVFGPPSF